MNKEEPKQEIPQLGTKEFNDLASYYFGGKPKQEPKQETLEEAAHKNDMYLLGQVKEPNFCYNTFSFIEGAKWQQQRMYSEEDMQDYANYRLLIKKALNPKEWFEKFKKKQDEQRANN